MQLADTVNLMLSGGTVLIQLGALLLAIFLLTHKPAALGPFLRAHGIPLAFCAALLAMLGSLTYSEILGYVPCKLCWIQRILMYPQVLLLGCALWGKHKGSHALVETSLILSVVGMLIAGYHYLLQLDIAPALPCAAVGYSAACSQRFFMEFGYITIPLMAFSAFLFIALALFAARKHSSAI